MVATEVSPAETFSPESNPFFRSKVTPDELASSFFEGTESFLQQRGYLLTSSSAAIVYQKPIEEVAKEPIALPEEEAKQAARDLAEHKIAYDYTSAYPLAQSNPDFGELTPAEAKVARKARRALAVIERSEITSLVFGTTKNGDLPISYHWQIYRAGSLTALTLSEGKVSGWRVQHNDANIPSQPTSLDETELPKEWGAVVHALSSQEMAATSREMTLRKQRQEVALHLLETTHLVSQNVPYADLSNSEHVTIEHVYYDEEKEVEMAKIKVELIGEALNKQVKKARERLAKTGFPAHTIQEQPQTDLAQDESVHPSGDQLPINLPSARRAPYKHPSEMPRVTDRNSSAVDPEIRRQARLAAWIAADNQPPAAPPPEQQQLFLVPETGFANVSRLNRTGLVRVQEVAYQGLLRHSLSQLARADVAIEQAERAYQKSGQPEDHPTAAMVVERQLVAADLQKRLGWLPFQQLNPLGEPQPIFPNGMYQIGVRTYVHDQTGFYVAERDHSGQSNYRTLARYEDPLRAPFAPAEAWVNLARDLLLLLS